MDQNESSKREEAIPHRLPNPFNLRDLQAMLALCCHQGVPEGVLSDTGLKDYFMKLCGFKEKDFILANWQSMSIKEIKRIKRRVRDAHPWMVKYGLHRVMFPPGKKPLDSLETIEAIALEYRELTYIPQDVYRTAVGGVHVLRALDIGRVEIDDAPWYLGWACQAGLSADVIRELAGKCGGKWVPIDSWARCAAERGHIDVIDLLVVEFGFKVAHDSHRNSTNYSVFL